MLNDQGSAGVSCLPHTMEASAKSECVLCVCVGEVAFVCVCVFRVRG